MFQKLVSLLGKEIKGKTVAILGLAFKPNTDDVRESASIDMIHGILEGGGVVRAYDPIANETMKSYYPDLNYFDSWEKACESADAVAIMTEWNEFRGMALEKLKSLMKSPILLDTRNIFSIEKLFTCLLLVSAISFVNIPQTPFPWV